MKKSNLIISSGAVLVAIIAISGIVFVSQAAEKSLGKGIDNSTGSGMRRGYGSAKIELSEEDKALWEAKAEERRTEQEVKRKEMEKIFETNDYEAWIAQTSEDCPMKEKVNEDNFDRFAEAHRLQNRGRKILEDEFDFMGQRIGKGMRNGGFHKIAE